MGFSTESNKSSTTGSKEFVKADRFINLYLTDAEGKAVKVSFIGLHKNIAHENALIEFLDADEKNVNKVVGALTADYRSATPTKAFAGFKFA